MPNVDNFSLYQCRSDALGPGPHYHRQRSSAALHYCKAHSTIKRKMENSTPCKMVTPENFILKLGTCYYVEEVTYYTIFDVDCFSGGASPQIGEI